MEDLDEEQTLVYSIHFDGDDKKADAVHKDGKASATFPNRDTYVGSYVGGKRHGSGVYTFASGARYDGEYKDNLRSGFGVFTTPDGASYSGEWLNNQRHGQGTYRYPNGDEYTGAWANGHKHGHGKYTFASGGSIHGHWVEGKCLKGHWHQPGAHSYTGQLEDNKLNGPGVFVLSNGVHQTGVHSGTEWHHDPEFLKPHPAMAPPAIAPADHHTQAVRAIQRAVLKLDHFQAIYRLPKRFEGVPNFRQMDGFPIFGSGQPTLDGITSVIQHLADQGFSKFVWTCMRQEPVIYVNQMSFAPREPHNLNENMEFEAITSELLHQLQESLANRFKLLGKMHAAIEYYQDTFAENPADRKNLLLKDPVTSDSSVRTITDVYEFVKTEKGFDVDLHRLPIADERAPRFHDFDSLVRLLKDTEEDTAILFNCQMGKGRTTTGMVCACLIRMVKSGSVSQENKSADSTEEDSPDTQEEAEEEKGDTPPPAPSSASIPFPEDPPNLAKGEYKVIVDLVQKLPDGVHVKRDVDKAIDAAHHMQNLRECIWYTKEMYDKETPERQKFWKRMAVNFIERYFFLICFQAYLRESIATEFDTSFAQWCADHSQLLAILGTRESGALANFEWQ